ncbi:uncharacterized protein LOC144383007 [Gasterosteus aculeatus]
MQAFLPSRSYLTPVRDEEAESQRKAKSRHARQTRRSTQGVTLTDLKEAQKSNILSPQNSRKAEGGPLAELSCLKNGLTDDRRVRSVSMETTETAEISPKWPDGPKWSKMDEQGNVERRLETIADSPMSDLPCSCVAGSRGLLHCNNAFTAGAICRRDENQNRVEDEAPLTRQRLFCDGEVRGERHRKQRGFDLVSIDGSCLVSGCPPLSTTRWSQKISVLSLCAERIRVFTVHLRITTVSCIQIP